MSHFPQQSGPSNPSAAELREAILHHIRYTLARSAEVLRPEELLTPVSLAIRDRIVDGMLETEQRYRTARAKRLYYLSMEFLMGRALGDNLCNLGLTEDAREALSQLGYNLEDVLEAEPDAGLGNGGLGRLAACFLESLATLGMPGFGYGIDYEFGLFRQEIVDGYQIEKPDKWKMWGTPFCLRRDHQPITVQLFGRVEESDPTRPSWSGSQLVVGVPRDMPVVGYRGATVNWLRLFGAAASEDFDIEIFNRGDYLRAVEQKIASENISRVLYPSDAIRSGKELRLVQEYFLVSCAVQDIVQRFQADFGNDWSSFAKQVAIQLNDTHPALTIAELMRVLVDQHELAWEQAFAITRATCAYTNHTLLPEALERWPLALLQQVLPRHMQIIFRINDELLKQVERSWPGEQQKQQRVSIIEEGVEKQVRMANLAIVGSHSVNGVSALHSKLVQESLVPEFAQLWPERFNNKTNGVSHRRWTLKANPLLAELLNATIGEGWVTDHEQLAHFENFVNDGSVLDSFLRAKQENKLRLARVIADLTAVHVDPESLFDVHIKRIHEYKRQLLNVLRIVDDYHRVIDDGEDITPRTYVFAGKAAPGYWAAKQIIKLINNVAMVVNGDPRVRGLMKVVFLPDYRVSLAEVIIPAADLSEQVSTAGMEASGTGNMKLAMNGALTIGTLDGANIEIAECVGNENIYIFGLRAHEVAGLLGANAYRPLELMAQSPRLQRVIHSIRNGVFSPGDTALFHVITETLLREQERYLHLADLPSYLDTQRRVEMDFRDPVGWAKRAMLNTARTGAFSSDRTIQEYAREIWKIERVGRESRETVHA